MEIISFPESEVASIREHLKENDTFHTVKIASEWGKYKKGEFIKTSWGERFVIIDIIQLKNMDHFKKEYIHYKELKNVDLEKIEKVANYKKIEILELKKVDNKKVY